MDDFLLDFDFVQDKINRRVNENVEKELVKIRENMITEHKEEIAEIAMKELRKEIAESMRKELKEEIAESMRKELKEEIAESMRKELKEEIAESMTKDITERTTKDITERVTENVSHKAKLLQSISLMLKKCQKNKSLPVIADEMETGPEELSPLYNLVSGNMEKSAEEICELAVAQKIQVPYL